LIPRQFELHLVPREVGRKLLAAGRLRSLLPPLVASDRLQGSVSDPFGCVDDFRRVAKVEDELLRIR
jgi:hypothetical protein